MKLLHLFALAFQACALAFFVYLYAQTRDPFCALMSGWSVFFAGYHTWVLRRGGVL